ncbi:DUF6470 family protein [Desulfitobacterium chlororespirans]|uniref:Uncharacterized protein n=1 Tax=Desulfitobacterium chlororespirans DSM 11544 TaxID=1121395 RepID=A0A1M7UD04_9FIRM|nr:DUF6470 family protein [Desulfitobacterium chlororespirans]SHN80921.1 hypothetical protein SAMN02745215_03488 [Desulfitobacterium chlororespirans DSM 11544]
MLQLSMRSYPIRLEYTIQNARLAMKKHLPMVEMENIPPQLQISQPAGKLTIDSTDYYHSIGLKTWAALSRENYDRGRQAALEGIAAIVEKGNRLAQISNPATNAIADMAFESCFAAKGELSFEPIIAPSVRYEASPAQIEVIPGKINYNLVRGRVDADYQPGKVGIQVTQYPRLDISVVDVRV